MAVAILRAKLDDHGIAAVVISGGTLGLRGRRAANFARSAIAEIDDDGKMKQIIDEHRSQGLSAQMLQRADDIVAMAPKHVDHIERMAPGIGPRIVRLWEYADDDSLRKIPDPVGHDATVFRGCRDLIAACLDQWIATWGSGADT